MPQPVREHTESVWSIAAIKVMWTQLAGSGCWLNVMWTEQTTLKLVIFGQPMCNRDLIRTQMWGNGCEATLDTGGGWQTKWEGESKTTRALTDGCDQRQQHKQRGKTRMRIRRWQLKVSWTQVHEWSQNEEGAKAAVLLGHRCPFILSLNRYKIGRSEEA